jgi:predicted transcriptional regulator
MKAIVFSINPEYALNILKGDKTRELRKSVPKGFVGWFYGYVTKSKSKLYFNKKNKEYVLCDNTTNITYYNENFQEAMGSILLNGTIPFRFWFDEYENIKWDNAIFTRLWWKGYYVKDSILNNLCLTADEVENYGKGKDLYAWHIKKLEIFDKPMELGDLYTWKWEVNGVHKEQFINTVTRPPQSWQYVWVKGESNE